MNINQQIEYAKAYLRTMPKGKFEYLVNVTATITGITAVLINPNIYIGLALLSLIISTVVYFRKER